MAVKEGEQEELKESAKQKAKNLLGKKPPGKHAAKFINKIEGLYYLTEKIIMSPYPDEKLIEKISDYMNEKHLNQYIVYNLSEYKYDNSYFNNSVFNSIFMN